MLGSLACYHFGGSRLGLKHQADQGHHTLRSRVAAAVARLDCYAHGEDSILGGHSLSRPSGPLSHTLLENHGP